MAPKLVGANYTPPDLHAKITGRAKYAEDFRPEGMVFAKVLASPMPHARVRRVDTRAAEAMEGVLAVLRAADEDLPAVDEFSEPVLTDEPMYEGQPILAVAAVTEKIAADAIEAIKIDLEPLPFALDPLESLRPGGPNAHVDGNSFVRERTEEGFTSLVKEIKWTAEDFDVADGEMPMGEWQDEWTVGEVEAGFDKAEVIVEEPLFFQSVTHHPMEPRSCMAYWQNGKLFIHPSTQSFAITHGAIARQVGLEDPADVVMINPFTGGGFGSKIVGSINMAIPAVLSKKIGRPVMHRVTRYEENYIGRARTGFQAKAKMGFAKDGRVTAIDLFIVQDNGPYGRQSDMSTAGSISNLTYQPETMRFRSVSVLTNTPPRSAQRAPGGAQIIAMLEPLVERAAKRLGVDRVAIRRLNAPENGGKFMNRGRESTVTTAYPKEALDQLAELVNWPEKQQLSGQKNGTKLTGVGFGISPYTAGSFGYDGLVLIRPDGKLQIQSGVGNLGTHSYSDTARVAADVLGMPWEECEVVWGDSRKGLPFTSIQAGSQTTHAISRAMYAGAMDAKKKLQEIAAKDLGGAAEQYDTGDGFVFRKGSPSRRLSFARAAARAIELGGKYDGHEADEDLNSATKAAVAVLAGQGLVGAAKDTFGQRASVYSWVVGFARVEIDEETGALDVVEYAAVTDCGTVMNPRSLGAQLHGGGIQGFGLARTQKWVFDPKWGVPFANRFYTARPPGILEVPREMQWGAVGLPDPNTPVGAKGIGEPPVGAGAAALICAIQDAVGDKVFRRTPIMTETILNALEGRTIDVRYLSANS